MAPKKNQQPKKISASNQRPNPAAAAAAAAKPKASTQQGRNEKQQKQYNALQRGRQEYAASQDLANFLNHPQGRDAPGGTVKGWLRPREVIVGVYHRPGPNEDGTASDPVTRLISNFKAKLVASSNAPAIEFGKDGYVFTVRSENFSHPREGQDVYSTLLETTFDIRPQADAGDAKLNPPFTEESLINAFKAEHELPDLSEQHAKDIFTFGKGVSSEADRKGVHCFAFRLVGDIWYDHKPAEKSEQVEELVKLLNFGVHLTVIRRIHEYDPGVFSYFRDRLAITIQKGVWAYYKGTIGKQEGALFQEWVKNPDRALKHQVWMERKQIQATRKGVDKYATQMVKSSFGSMREYEIVHSVALIYEKMHKNEIIRNYFDWDKVHKARVMGNVHGYVTIDVTATRQDDTMIPFVGMDSKFKVKKIVTESPGEMDTTIDDAESEQQYGPEIDKYHNHLLDPATYEGPREDVSKSAPKLFAPCYTEIEYSGRVIHNEKAVGDFCISFMINSVDERQQYVVEEEIDVSLYMTKNQIPIKRELMAVAKVAKRVKAQDFKGRAMQNFLMGKGNDNFEENFASVLEEAKTRMTEAEWKDLTEYKSKIDLNESQEEIWKAIFNHRWFVTQLQGPSGACRTRTVSIITMSFAMLKVKTALCAPSNVATLECLKGVVEQLEAALKVNPQIKDRLKVVYLTTNATTKQSIRETADIQAAYDFLEEGVGRDDDPYKEYKLYSHIISSFARKADLKIGDHQAAEDWLRIRDELLRGKDVSPKLMKEWVNLGIQEGEAVFKDPAVKIVISTCNNADQMDQYNYKPWACVLEECDLSKEQESLIPLSLGARFNYLVGDYQQLRPMVRSRGHNEFAAQLGLSIYERFYGHHSVPLLRLRDQLPKAF